MTAPYEIYSRLLFKAGQGYPLWNPALPAYCPEEYKLAGMQVGDVGYLTPDGGFFFLFNISLSKDHPINKWRGVPDDFIPVDLGPIEIYHQSFPEFYPPKSVFCYTEKGAKSIEGEITASIPGPEHSPVTVQARGGHHSSYSEAAALVLLKGGSKNDNYRNLFGWAAQYALRLYRYANVELGLNVPNGGMYLITGVTNTDSWYISSFSEKSGGNYGSFEVGVKGFLSGNLSASTASSVTGSCAPRYSPPHHKGQNQSVFIRGLKMMMKSDIFGRLKPKMTDIHTASFSALGKVGPPPCFPGSIPETPMSSTTGRGAPHGGETTEETTTSSSTAGRREPHVGEVREGTTFNHNVSSSRTRRGESLGREAREETTSNPNISSSTTRREPHRERREGTAADKGKKPQKPSRKRRSQSPGPRGPAERKRDGPGGGAGGAGQSGGQGSGGNARGGGGQADRDGRKDNEGKFNSGGGKESVSGRQRGGWAAKENFSDDSESGDSQADPMLHPYHPSDVVNKYLLQMCPQSEVALTHDDTWASIFHESDSVILDEELLERINISYDIHESDNKACVFVLRDGSETHSQSPKLEEVDSTIGRTSRDGFHPAFQTLYTKEPGFEDNVALHADVKTEGDIQIHVPDSHKLQSGAYPLAKPPSRLFALIIGVNKYESPDIPNLLGAVPDADAMRDYLQEHLGVPSSQIRNLRDSEATRAAIINEISALSLNSEIKEGDPIMIYYAGYGASAPAPKGWEVGSPGKIELLVPYDYSSRLEDGNHKHGVPNRTLEALLSRLASRKGDNITVILDCCHSGSGTRNYEDPTELFRGVDVRNAPSNLDQDVWSDFETSKDVESGSMFHSGFAHKDLRSHVLLAACGAEELAYERTSRGMFTGALLKTLVEIGLDKLTYTGLIQQISHLSTGQNPQCVGVNRHRIIFNLDTVYHKIRSEGDRYVMPDVGILHGITVGDEFQVYQDPACDYLLGTVVASELSDFLTTLDAKESRFALEQDGIAFRSNLANSVLARQRIDLDDPISLHRKANALWTRFEQEGHKSNLDEAISLHRQALELRPPLHPNRSDSLNNLANALLLRFEQGGQEIDLDDAVSLHRDALALRAALHPNRSDSLNNLATTLLARFKQGGREIDLDEAISFHRQALELRPPPHPNRSDSLNNLANALLLRFEQGGQEIDLDDAMSLHREALALRAALHPNRSDSLNNLATSLLARFKQGGREIDLDEAISFHRQALELRPPPHPNRSDSLNNLANALRIRFQQGGQEIDLNDVISLHREALALRPPLHPNRSDSLNNLANALLMRFEQGGQEIDLDDAMSLHREALALRPALHSKRSDSLNNLATTLLARFKQGGREIDLDEAISLHRKVLELLPPLHPNRSDSLNNLAHALWIRFEQGGQEIDLDDREALTLQPPPHPNQFGPSRRPATISELAERASIPWDESKGFKHYLKLAEKHRLDGKEYARSGDVENAFVELAKAATLVLERLPKHPDYNTKLNFAQRHNIGLNSQEILDNLAELKPGIVDRYEKWRQSHPDVLVENEKAERVRQRQMEEREELERLQRAMETMHGADHFRQRQAATTKQTTKQARKTPFEHPSFQKGAR